MAFSEQNSVIRDIPWEIAPDIYCLGPAGRTQTNIYFVRSGESSVLIDAGWASDAPRIERAAQSLFGTHVKPAAILLTHCHPDHSGSALQVARTWECAVYMHENELPIATGDFGAMQACAGPLDRWIILPIMRAIGSRRRNAILEGGSLRGVARALGPENAVPNLEGWQWIATPGHTPGHVAYFRAHDRVLISGDAIVTLNLNSVIGLLSGRPGLSGPPWYTTWSANAAIESIRVLARLEPAVLGSGHGKPMIGPETAVALRTFAASL